MLSPEESYFIDTTVSSLLNTSPLTLESLDLFMEEGGTEECTSAISVDSDNDNDSPQPLCSMSWCTTPVIDEELPENLSALFVDVTTLQMASSKHFDLIFLDQYMTSVDKQLLGTETAHALRGKGFDGAICGLSANDMEYSFIKAGANAFMIKPFPCKPLPVSYTHPTLPTIYSV